MSFLDFALKKCLSGRDLLGFSCNTDSGSPLTANGEIIGVASFGKKFK